jgi:hypothetical protein
MKLQHSPEKSVPKVLKVNAYNAEDETESETETTRLEIDLLNKELQIEALENSLNKTKSNKKNLNQLNKNAKPAPSSKQLSENKLSLGCSLITSPDILRRWKEYDDSKEKEKLEKEMKKKEKSIRLQQRKNEKKQSKRVVK